MTEKQPRLISYERRAEFVFNNSDAGAYYNQPSMSHSHYDGRVQPQRSSSFQRRPLYDESAKGGRLRRVSNSVAPISVGQEEDRRIDQRMLVNGVVDRRFPRYPMEEDTDPVYHALRGNVFEFEEYSVPPSDHGSHYYSPVRETYDNVPSRRNNGGSEVQETDIVDDASDAVSDMYQPGRYQGDDDGSTSDEADFDDPEFLELQERENIIRKYSEGPEGKNIDDWENPESDLFRKMDRFGFLHKDDKGLTDEEKAHKLRIETEYRREKKWKSMLEVWPKLRAGERPKKLEERIWKGIPTKWRMTVWPRLLDVEYFKSQRPDTYQDLLLRARLVSKDIKQIDLDINRTYRDHEAFRRRYDVKQQSLLNVLAAYSMYNTEVGYCQGMSQIAALFLMFLDEEDAFWCMHSLMVSARHTMHGFFVPGFPKLTRFEAHFKKVLKKYRPRIYKHFEKQDIPYIYLTKWWFGCFLDRVPFSLALRLWDVFLIEGDSILIAMALNIMKMHEKRILKLQIDSFMEFIQMKIATDFGFSDNETMISLRETLTKLRSDRLHIPPPPKDTDLPEVPTKALGPILAKPLGTIRDELCEIQSRHSLAVSNGRSPYPGRKRSKNNRSGSRTPHNQSMNKLSTVGTDEMRLPQGNGFRGNDSHSFSNGKEVPFEIPQRHYSQRKAPPSTPPPDPRHNHHHHQHQQHQQQTTMSPSSKMRNGSSSVYDSDRALLQGTSSFRDERTGCHVTIVRADDDEEDLTSPPIHSRNVSTCSAARVTQGTNNVTYISLGDEGSSVL